MKYLDTHSLKGETIKKVNFGNDNLKERNSYGVITIITESDREIILSSSYLHGEISIRENL